MTATCKTCDVKQKGYLFSECECCAALAKLRRVRAQLCASDSLCLALVEKIEGIGMRVDGIDGEWTDEQAGALAAIEERAK